MSRSPIQFMDRELEKQLAIRGKNLNQVAKTCVENYLYLIKEIERTSPALREITQNERMLICDSLNGIMYDTHTAHLLWANIDDSVRQSALDKKWEVDGTELVRKLRALSLVETFVLWDLVERFWSDK